ncbi:MAG: hypothetical protein HYY24_06850 [Verrucomicrobia bacterium]|nr:hypothetical protein [Verrucomicrobiota bacterium]
MTSGYCMTEHALREPILGFVTPPVSRHDWDFLKIKPLLEEPAESPQLMQQLKVADQLAFRIWLLSRSLQIVGAVLAVGLVVLAVYVGIRFQSHTLFSLTAGQILIGLVGVALAAAGWAPLVKAIRFRKTFQSILLGFGMATLGFLLARVHLHWFDRWFLRRGRLARLLKTE